MESSNPFADIQKYLDPSFDLTKLDNPELQKHMGLLKEQLKGYDVNKVLKGALKSAILDQEVAKAFIAEDHDFHRKEKDITKQCAYVMFQENVAKRYAQRTETHRNQEARLSERKIPVTKIEPIEMAKYSCVTFEELEEEQEFHHRYLAVKIISEPSMTAENDEFSFLMIDSASDSNRVIRCNIMDSEG